MNVECVWLNIHLKCFSKKYTYSSKVFIWFELLFEIASTFTLKTFNILKLCGRNL